MVWNQRKIIFMANTNDKNCFFISKGWCRCSVDYSLPVTGQYKSTEIQFSIIIFMLAALLHQSQVIFGVNISFADIFCLILLLGFIYRKDLSIPIIPAVFFLIVSTVVLSNAAFYIPLRFMYTPQPMGILSDYMKLIAIFVYFILGYNLSKAKLIKSTVKWYSYWGLFIGGMGVFFTLFNIGLFSNILFFEHTRFRGLMIDPNYFSVLQITALVFISRSEAVKSKYKYLAFLITALSVLISGSKTGIITLITYLALRFAEFLLLQKKNIKSLIAPLIIIGLFIMIVPVIMGFLQTLFNFFAMNIPSFSRVELLFTNFGEAFSENGSGRNITWKVALQLIQLSPIIGIGIGTYQDLAIGLFNESDISHNTFLQLSAEWGIPLALIFFLYVFFTIGKATISGNLHGEQLIIRDMIIILLIGSMAISLNNARILWLMLGALTESLEPLTMKEQFRRRADNG